MPDTFPSLSLLTAFAVLAGSAAQAGTVPLPQGCSAHLTVQQRQCLVTHHYTCKGDPDGHQWRVDLTDQGVTYAAQIDAEGQWVYSLDIFGGREEILVEGADDPASMTELLNTDLDSWDFQTRSQGGDVTRFFGFDAITGTATIDGVDLLTSQSQITATDAAGETMWSATGSQYVHPELRVFFFGIDTFTDPEDGDVETNHTPVDFIYPGERGFLSDTPAFDCNEMNARFDAWPDAAQLLEVSQ